MCEKEECCENMEFFQWFVAPEGRKEARWSGGCGASWPDERDKKLRALVVQSTFPSQKCKKTDGSGALLEGLWRFEMSKKCTLAPSKFPSQNIEWQAQCKRHVHRVVRRSGRWFPEKRFWGLILRDRRSTSCATWHHFFMAGIDRWVEKSQKTHWHEAVNSALNYPFLKEACRVASLFW